MHSNFNEQNNSDEKVKKEVKFFGDNKSQKIKIKVDKKEQTN